MEARWSSNCAIPVISDLAVDMTSLYKSMEVVSSCRSSRSEAEIDPPQTWDEEDGIRLQIACGVCGAPMRSLRALARLCLPDTGAWIER